MRYARFKHAPIPNTITTDSPTTTMAVSPLRRAPGADPDEHKTAREEEHRSTAVCSDDFHDAPFTAPRLSCRVVAHEGESPSKVERTGFSAGHASARGDFVALGFARMDSDQSAEFLTGEAGVSKDRGECAALEFTMQRHHEDGVPLGVL